MPERAPAHAAVILAAGASRRLGRPKQLLLYQGETLVRRAARLALATQPACALVVVGAAADAVFAAVGDLAVRRVECDGWAQGMGASLRAALAALPADIAAALIVLCDQPALDSAHLQGLCHAWRAEPHKAAASFYAGRLGVPALLPRGWFATIGSGDAGAREVLAQRSADVVAIANEALARDVDRDDDLRTLDP